jgi:hypothetical protein
MLPVDEADVHQRLALAPLLAGSLTAMHCSTVVRGEAIASRRCALMLMLHAATKGHAATRPCPSHHARHNARSPMLSHAIHASALRFRCRCTLYLSLRHSEKTRRRNELGLRPGFAHPFIPWTVVVKHDPSGASLWAQDPLGGEGGARRAMPNAA